MTSFGVLSLGKQAGIDENPLSAGHKGVNALIVDEINLDHPGTKARSLKNRLRIEPHQAFDLCIPDELRRPPPGRML